MSQSAAMSKSPNSVWKLFIFSISFITNMITAISSRIYNVFVALKKKQFFLSFWGPVIINGREWDRREKGWLNQNLKQPKGGLRKNGTVVRVGNIFLA